MDSRDPIAGTVSGDVTWPVRSGVIPPLAEGFVTRSESAPGLEQGFAPGATLVLTPARPATRAGSPDWLGTCGKTQAAVYLAESLWRSGELDLLVWITATSRVPILEGYAKAAVAAIGVDPAADAESLAARFVGWLAQTSRPWLVVLDDLSGPWDLDGLWPAGPAGRALITTAEPTVLLGKVHMRAVPITEFSRREALSYLLGRLAEDRDQRAGAMDLVDHLGGEPLALAQASAVIESSSLSCRDYLDHLTRKRSQLGMPAHGSSAAAISWTLSVEQAFRLLPGGPVQPLLTIAAMLDGHCIPGSVFTTAAARDYAGGDARGLASPEDASRAVLSIEQAGLLTIDQACTPPIVRISPAVQAAIRSATSGDTLDKAAVAAADALLECWTADEPETWLAECLRSCASSVAQLAGDLLWTGNCYRLLFRIGEGLESARLTRLAAAHWSEVAAASEQFLGVGHPDTLVASDRLAAAFLEAGRATEALPWFERVLADRSGHLGPGHPGTITAAVSLGRAMLAADRAEEAAGVLERAVTECAKVHGADDIDTLDARDALASACCAAGHVTDGLRMYEQTLSDRERVQGKSHPATLDTSEKLGDALLAHGQFKEALAQYKRVVAGRERAQGADHPDTIGARSSLASAYHSAGRMATALQLYEQACADSERVLGIDHPATLARQVSLAHAYYAVGRLGDATSLLKGTGERCDRVLSPRDPLVQMVREDLANITGT